MAFLAFAKIDGIEGDSKRKGFEKQIELAGIEHAISQPVGVSAGGRGALTVSQSNHQPLVLVKEHDKATPKLQHSNSRPVPKILYDLCRRALPEPLSAPRSRV
jgi:type VI secretion system Hcp family effector